MKKVITEEEIQRAFADAILNSLKVKKKEATNYIG